MLVLYVTLRFSEQIVYDQLNNFHVTQCHIDRFFGLH